MLVKAGFKRGKPLAYPEVNIQVSCTPKLPISHLEGNCHLVIPVKDFVKAFSPMRLQLNVVCQSSSKQAACCQEDRGEPHDCKMVEDLQ